VPWDEPLAVPAYDYADAFEIAAEGDPRTAEEWLRAGLEGSPATLRVLIRVVHGRVLRFRLGPPSPDHILGWRIASSSLEVVQVTAGGPLGRGVLVGRRTGTAVVLTTYVVHGHPLSRLVWALVLPLHRRVAPYLLTRASRCAPS
jgi:hypothetical protein